MSNQSFPRTHRFLATRDFSRVFNNTKIKINLPHFLVLVADSATTHSRLGCVVAKKHVKHANQRNRIKRIIRETFRLHQCKLITVDILIMVKSGITEQENKTLFQELETLWQKQGLVKKTSCER